MDQNMVTVVNAVGEVITDRDARIAALESQVADLYRMLGSGVDEEWQFDMWSNESARDMVFRLEGELARANGKVTRLESDVTLWKGHAAKATNSLEEAQAEVTKKTARIERYRVENTALRYELDRLKSFALWKIKVGPGGPKSATFKVGDTAVEVGYGDHVAVLVDGWAPAESEPEAETPDEPTT